MPIYSGRGFLKPLIDAGVLPQSTRRVVIDADFSGLAVVYYECYARDEHLAAASPENIRDASPIEVKSIAEVLMPGRLDLHFLSRQLADAREEIGRITHMLETINGVVMDYLESND